MLLDKVSGIEVEELSIGELGQVIFEVEIFLLLGGHVVGGGEGIEIGEIVRDVGCLARLVTVHGHGQDVIWTGERIQWMVKRVRHNRRNRNNRGGSGENGGCSRSRSSSPPVLRQG